MGVDRAEGKDAGGRIATAEEVVGGTVLNPAETIGTETNRVEAEIGGEAESARPAQAAADMEVLIGLKVTGAVDLEGSEGADPDVALAELGGITEGDLVAENAAEVVAAATGEEGSAIIATRDTVVGIDVEGASVGSAIEGAVAGDEPVEDEALATVDLKVQVALEGGRPIDPHRVVVPEDEVGLGRAERAADFDIVDLHGLEAVVADLGDPVSRDSGAGGGNELAVTHGEHRTETQVRVRIGGDELGIVGAIAVGEEAETTGVGRATRVDLDRGTNPEGIGVTRSSAGLHHPSVNLPETDVILTGTSGAVGEDEVVGPRLDEGATVGIEFAREKEATASGAELRVRQAQGGVAIDLDDAFGEGNDRRVDGETVQTRVLSGRVDEGGGVRREGGPIAEGAGGDRDVKTVRPAPTDEFEVIDDLGAALASIEQVDRVQAECATLQGHASGAEGGHGLGLEAAKDGRCAGAVGHATRLDRRATGEGAVSIKGQDAILHLGEADGAGTIVDGAAEGRIDTQTVLDGEGGASSDATGDGAVSVQSSDGEVESVEVKDPGIVHVQRVMAKGIPHGGATELVLEGGAGIGETKRAVLDAEHRKTGSVGVEEVARAGNLKIAGARLGEVTGGDVPRDRRGASLALADIDDGLGEAGPGAGPEEGVGAERAGGVAIDDQTTPGDAKEGAAIRGGDVGGGADGLDIDVTGTGGVRRADVGHVGASGGAEGRDGADTVRHDAVDSIITGEVGIRTGSLKADEDRGRGEDVTAAGGGVQRGGAGEQFFRGTKVGQGGGNHREGAVVDAVESSQTGQGRRGQLARGSALREGDGRVGSVVDGRNGEGLGGPAADERQGATFDRHRAAGGHEGITSGGGGADDATAMAREPDTGGQLLAATDDEGGHRVGAVLEREGPKADFAQAEGSGGLGGQGQGLSGGHVDPATAVGEDELTIGGETAGDG